MNLFEYIKSQLPQIPNAQIMKDLGASEELIGYIRETPWNTNLGMLAAYGCEPSGGTDTVTITLVEWRGWAMYECETDEPISSPHTITVAKGSKVTLPNIKSDGSFGDGYGLEEGVSGDLVQRCDEYEAIEDVTLYTYGEPQE